MYQQVGYFSDTPRSHNKHIAERGDIVNRKSISLFLVVVMMLTLLPFGALAADEPEEPSEAGYANIQEWQQKYGFFTELWGMKV